MNETIDCTVSVQLPIHTTADALAAILREEPADRTVRAALVDALLEAGSSRWAAVRAANAVAREGAGSIAHRTARAFIRADGSAAAKARTAIRERVNRGSSSSIEVTVVAGNAAPVLSGEDAHSTFRKGGACHSPGAAIRAGYKVDYHRSTLKITVGGEWVASNVKGYAKFLTAHQSVAARIARHRAESVSPGKDMTEQFVLKFGRGPWSVGDSVRYDVFAAWRLTEIARLEELTAV